MPVGRLFIEIGKNVDRMNESMRQAMTTAQAAGPEFAKITAAGQSLIAKFQDALNPTKKFKEQLDLLKAAGMSQADVWKVMGDDLSKAADKTKQMGQIIDPTVKKMLEFGKATEGSKFSFESLGKTIQDFAQNPVQAAQSGITSLLSNLGPTAVGLGAVATGAIAAGVAIFEMAKSAAEGAEQIKNLSYATGMTAEEVQALQRLGQERGLGDLASGIEKLNTQLGKAEGGEFTEAILKMGIAVKENASAVYYLEQMRQKYIELKNEIGEHAAAQEMSAALGRRLIGQFGPLIMNTEESITGALEGITESGAVMSNTTIDNLARINTKIEEHGRVWVGLWNKVKEKAAESYDWLTATGMTYWAQAMVPPKVKSENIPIYGPNLPTAADPSELINRQKAIAAADAIASGAKRELIGLTTQLNELEKQYAEIKKGEKGLNFDADALRDLAQHIASKKEQIAQEQHYLDLLKNYKPIWSDFKEFTLLTEKETTSLKELAAQLEKIRKDDELQPISGIFGKKEDFWLSSEGATFEGELPITKALNESIKKTAEEHKRQYQKMIESVRDGAGQVFDAMVSRGKGAFSSLGDWIEGFFLTRLRKMFENLVLYIMQGFKGGLAQVLAGVIPGMGMGGGGGFGGFGFSGLGGMGTLGAMAGGLGLTAGMMMPGPLGLKIGTGVGAGLLGGAGMITAGLIPGMGAASFGSALSFLGSGAGLFGSGGLLGLGALTVPIVGAVVAGLPFLIKSIMGKSTEQAGAMEVTRDLGGISFGKDQFKTFFGGLGLSESDTWGIRKDLIVSPKFLAEIAGPIAEAQGKMNSFLAALEKVQTSWGNFDFRKAYEVGKATGDWTALNKAFEDAFEHSEKLREEMPNWKELLAAPAAVAKTEVDLLVEALTAFRDAVQGSLTPVESMYDTFLKTGEVTDELAKKITELGGDLSAFQGLKPLLDQSAGLQAQIGFIQSLTSSIAALAPELDPINQLLSGKMGPEAIAALTGANLDPAKFTNLMDVISAKNSFNFQPFQTLTPELQSILSKYGGTAGQLAIEKYGQGFNTITQALLASTKATMDEAYQNAVKDALQYLGEQQKKATDKLQELIDKIDQVKKEIINQSNIMLGNAKTPSVTEPNLPPAEENPNPGGSGGGSGPGKEILPTSIRDRPVNINFYGPVYGAADFDARVQQAKLSLSRQGAW